MHIKHELAERTLEPREPTLEYDKACARQLRGGIEIHLPERFAELEMLLRRETVASLGTEAVVLHIIACVLAVRSLRQRQVGNLRKRIVEFLRELLLLRLERRDFFFQ